MLPHAPDHLLSIQHPWHPDQGDGTYRNPIICADYSDPDVIRVGDDYYLTASSFNCTPGLPILHSRDLVNWSIIGHALEKLPDPRYAVPQHGQGVWAPALRHHAGRFWIFFPTPDEGLYVITAASIQGPWSEPRLILAGKGLIDPCPLWDDDGQAWLMHAYAFSRAGIKNKLHLRPMDPVTGEIIGPGRIVFDAGPDEAALEGPKLHKRNGYYYLSCPAGGVQMGWQLILRSRSLEGPFAARMVLAQRGTAINGPHQGALVDTPAGEWWFVHFQDLDVYGRVVHLQPVRWEDDWPLIGIEQDEAGVGQPALRHREPAVEGQPVPPAIPQTSDDFSTPQLGLQWQWHANSGTRWYSLGERPGHLRLYAQFCRQLDFQRAGNLLLQKFPAIRFSAETELELPEGHPDLHAGLIIMGRQFAALNAQRMADGYRLQLLLSVQPRGCELIATRKLRLRVEIEMGGWCRFGCVLDDGSLYYLSHPVAATAGVWIGAKIGLYCVSPNMLDCSGYADFGSFRVLPISETLLSEKQNPV